MNTILLHSTAHAGSPTERKCRSLSTAKDFRSLAGKLGQATDGTRRDDRRGDRSRYVEDDRHDRIEVEQHENGRDQVCEEARKIMRNCPNNNSTETDVRNDEEDQTVAKDELDEP